MRFWATVTCASIMGAFAMPAAAQSAGITYDCDTAANHYSELLLPAGPDPFTVTGNIKLLTIIPGENYVTMTRLSVSTAPAQPGPSSEAWAGFEIVVLKPSAKKPGAALLSSSLRPKGGDSVIEPMAPPAVVKTADDFPVVPFELAYDGRQAAIRLGGEEKTLKLVTARPVVQIVCSTGEFLYTDLVIRPGP